MAAPLRPAVTKTPLLSAQPRSKPRGLFLGLFLALTTAAPLIGYAASELQARYPYDPACPWGRLSNGQGMLSRCLSEAEATNVHSGQVQSTPAPQECPCPTAGEPEKKPEDEPAEAEEKKANEEFDLNVGPIEADQGDITIGRLGVPLDRYRSCVTENGGLTDDSAQVVVKFLVRGERVRAEGVSVASSKGVSRAAADCIAFVVDRRKVGVPSAPLTGARLTFSMKKR